MREQIVLGRAHVRVVHSRPKNWKKDPRTGLLVPDVQWAWSDRLRCLAPLEDQVEVVDEAEALNLITNAGRVFMHTQCYGSAGLGANGLNYIALSNDTLTETAASTTLSNEIAANGLTRAQGTVTLPTGSGTQTTVAKTFTATGAQSAQKAALFTAAAAGTMQHALAFTQQTLANGNTLAVTFTLTLGA